MAALQGNLLSSSTSTPLMSSRKRFLQSLRAQPSISLPKLVTPSMIINIEQGDQHTITTGHYNNNSSRSNNNENDKPVARLYAIAEAGADRADMHDIIGQQRNSWNHLLLHSINSLTLTASVTAGISSILESSPHVQLAFKLSSTLLFATSTVMMIATNKIQPSQLAEEQRNATRLFRQIDRSIHTTLAVRIPTEADVKMAMERVLALDKAYPLPLLPGMLEKFPKTLKPTVWWPKFDRTNSNFLAAKKRGNMNGWSKGLEKEMKAIVGMVRSKDMEQYVNFGNNLLRINRILAVTGPILTGLATVGASMVGIGALGPWPVLFGVVGGALATVTNTLQHGGQVGMLFELCRNVAGFYKHLEVEIEANLEEEEVGKREDGDLFEMKVALRLGRSLSELQGFGRQGEDIGEFAGKLF